MVDAKDVNKIGEGQTQAAGAGASAGAANQAPQAQPNAQPQVGQPQDLQLGALVEEMRTYLQKTVDALNAVSSGMQSAQEVQRGMSETMAKIANKLEIVEKTIGSVIAENKKQEAERQDAPKEPHADPGAGETTEHKEVMPTDAELKEKVPGKQTLGQKQEEVGKTAKGTDIVKIGGATPSPQAGTKIEETDISKSMISDILSGKLKGAGNVINRVTGGKQ